MYLRPAYNIPIYIAMHLSYNEKVLLLLTLSCWFCMILSCQPGQLCQWTSWHPWAACNTTCGSGVQSRWRGVCCDDQRNLDFLGCIAHCNLSRTQYREYKTCNDASMCTLAKRHTFLSGKTLVSFSYVLYSLLICSQVWFYWSSCFE